ncbi:MAG: efflux RND transporter periplasmic adaptor subunit [Pirellulaceae bacterium]
MNRKHHPFRRFSQRCMVIVLGTNLVLALGCTNPVPVVDQSKSVRQIPVKTVTLAQSEIQRTTQQPATVHAFHRTEIRVKATGFIKSLYVDIGDYVEAGRELATIDVPELVQQKQVMENRIRRLEADERKFQAGLNLAEARVRAAQAMMSEAEFKLAGAEALLAAAQAEFDRTQDLVQRGSLQNRMLDEARKKRDSESANINATRSTIESASADVAVTEALVELSRAELATAKADTQIARAQLQELDVQISYATVKAPITGIVTARTAEPGDLVRALSEVGKGDPLFVISQVDKVRVRIPVPEADAPFVNQGDQITLTFPSFSAEAPIQAVISRRSSHLDPSTRTMIAEADLSNEDGKLLPGMFGQARIDFANVTIANVLPSQAIRFEDGGKAYVYVVDQDDTVSVVPVTTGMDDGNSIEILSGIQLGQRVIDSHLKRFTDGQRVKPL